MLHYFKAFSIFLLWVLIALTTHFYVSYKLFNTCNLPVDSLKKVSINKSMPLLIKDTANNLIYNFSKGFTIKKQKSNVSSINKIPYLKDSIQHILNNDYSSDLHITGKYLQNETSSNPTQNLGLLRANFVKKELVNKGVNSSKIKIFSEISSFSYSEIGIYSNGINLKFSTTQQSSIDSLEALIENKILYIEFENDSLISNLELTNYTLLLKQYLKKHANKKITITGHTDNLGYYENNLIIGLFRENNLKNYFTKNDIDFNRIKTVSKGESEPIANKTTEKGRAKNKRIEITIN